MNILVDPLPQTVEVGGAAWAINSDFYIGILFELLMQDQTLTEEEKVTQALTLYYPVMPPDLERALERLLWFYRCGEEVKQEFATENPPAGKPQKAYCFEQDADLIFAAFCGQYCMDLSAVSGLHWWKFRALFRGLAPECQLVKVMGYRTADLTGMSKGQKKLYERMQKVYALKNQRNVETVLSLQERNQGMKDYVTRRFAEAGVTD